MGLFLVFDVWGSPRCMIDVSNNGFVCVNGDVLHGYRLLPGSSVPVETLGK